ncbi:MAG: glycosyltransferase family 2 protein [Ndongobacter sp.]|nr:glycosyltransferase family 2 protein [Ndongobacter sp.]
MAAPILYLIIPCYNEQDVLPITCSLFLDKLTDSIQRGKISDKSRILFVNDGSRDRTWQIICDLAKSDPHYTGIAQSRNRGHQNAVLAGLMEAKDRCDITISIDCDGQDDIRAVDDMIDAYLDGCEIVYGVRSRRDTDSFFKRFTAEGFYKLLRRMGADIVFNHADYRLISSRVLQELAKFKEVNIFLRGMVPLVGFRSTSVYYERTPRLAGESHYPLKKMLALAFDGITSLSVRPIRIITSIGLLFAALSFIGVLWAVIRALGGHVVSGWASTVSIICFMGGVQLVCLGVIGEYIGKIYMETKARPRYIISDRTGDISEAQNAASIENHNGEASEHRKNHIRENGENSHE